MAHGGKRENAGRKPKAEELKLQEKGLNAIKKVYGSIDSYWEHIARESKESYPHLKMLTEYIYGKPKETQTLKFENSIPVIDMSEWK